MHNEPLSCKKHQSWLQKTASILVALLFWSLIWQVGAMWYGKPLLLPTPLEVAPRFFGLFIRGEFWSACATTILSLLIGYLFGCLVGILVGCLVAKVKFCDTLFSPLFSMIRATPVACFVIIAWVLLGSGRLPAFISALMVAPVMMTNVAAGVRATPTPLLETAKVYHLSFWDTIRVCYVPSVSPHLSSGLITSWGLAWKAGIAAEIIALSANTLGYHVYQSKSFYMDVIDLFAWTIAIILIDLIIEAVLVAFLNLPKIIRRKCHD